MIPLKKGRLRQTGQDAQNVKYLGALLNALDKRKINTLSSSLANTRPFFSKASYESTEKTRQGARYLKQNECVYILKTSNLIKNPPK